MIAMPLEIGLANPWTMLPLTPPYLLPEDKWIHDFNGAQRSNDTKFMLESLPEPFIGNPNSATVVLLGKNPGHSEQDPREHRDRAFREAILLNLRHELHVHPFYPLNPDFSHTGAGIWWRKHLRELCDECKLVDITTRLMVVEWFPYHSAKFKSHRFRWQSREYTEALVRYLLGKGAMVVLLRAKTEWTSINCHLGENALINPQNPCISHGNTPAGLFANIVSRINSDH
jgi:hypothetical protein